MRKIFSPVFLAFLLLTSSLALFLNTSVTTKKGNNYIITKTELPLYLKLLGFFDRHFNYQLLVKQIAGHLKTPEEKVFKLFQWTYETIRPQPKSLPIMDSHVWDVYIRGYGVSDNFHDLFSTLCNYSGVDAFFERLMFEDSRKHIDITFVKFRRGWVVFDPFNGAYFENRNGNWATTEEIRGGDWKLAKLPKSVIQASYYSTFIKLVPEVVTMGYRRANTQSPVNRFKLQLHKFLSGQEPLLE